MESYYDKDAGVAWGPITKEEMLDDLLVYVPQTVKNRKTLGCSPTFENKLYRHDSSNKLDIEECKECMLKENEIVILSSDEENLTESCFSCKDSFNTNGNSHEENEIVILSSDEENLTESCFSCEDSFNTYGNSHDEGCDSLESPALSSHSTLEVADIHEDHVPLEQIKNFSEELCPLSSTSNEVSISKLKPKIIISDTKPKSTMKSALPVYNRKVVTHKMMPTANARSPLLSVKPQANYQSLKSTPTHSKQQFVHPAPKTASAKKRFQHIESPISIYIKNAGVSPLFKQITPLKPLSCDKVMVNSTRSCSNKENSVLFPEVVYRPAKHVIVNTDKVVKLPSNINSLIPHIPTVTKHVDRIGQHSKENIRKRLLEADSTVNSSLSTEEDMSIHVTKAAYI